jgi:hypothetical protein
VSESPWDFEQVLAVIRSHSNRRVRQGARCLQVLDESPNMAIRVQQASVVKSVEVAALRFRKRSVEMRRSMAFEPNSLGVEPFQSG